MIGEVSTPLQFALTMEYCRRMGTSSILGWRAEILNAR